MQPFPNCFCLLPLDVPSASGVEKLQARWRLLLGGRESETFVWRDVERMGVRVEMRGASFDSLDAPSASGVEKFQAREYEWEST